MLDRRSWDCSWSHSKRATFIEQRWNKPDNDKQPKGTIATQTTTSTTTKVNEANKHHDKDTSHSHEQMERVKQ